MDKPYQPTRCNRASICHWNLEFRFYTKEQCTKFIKLLMKEDIEYHFEYWYEMSDSYNPPEYWVKITDHAWAKNLVRIAKLLEKVDYQMD